jgi:large subunit ribosomal protein L33
MAKSKKKNVVKVVMMGAEGVCYYTTRNQKNHPEKLSFRKYNPKTRTHEVFNEKKLAKSAKKI